MNHQVSTLPSLVSLNSYQQINVSPQLLFLFLFVSLFFNLAVLGSSLRMFSKHCTSTFYFQPSTYILLKTTTLSFS